MYIYDDVYVCVYMMIPYIHVCLYIRTAYIGKIMKQGKVYLETTFPDLDYITSCELIKDDVEWIPR